VSSLAQFVCGLDAEAPLDDQQQYATHSQGAQAHNQKRQSLHLTSGKRQYVLQEYQYRSQFAMKQQHLVPWNLPRFLVPL